MSEITDIHIPFMRYLREQGIEFVRARSDRQSTIERGWVDFTIIDPVKPALLLEMKTEKGELDKYQKEVHARLTDRGFRVFVPRDIAAAIELVKAWRSEVKHEAPRLMGGGKLYIRAVGERGDHIVDRTGLPTRRASFADYATYPRWQEPKAK